MLSINEERERKRRKIGCICLYVRVFRMYTMSVSRGTVEITINDWEVGCTVV